jgi:hypothetical protein
VLKGFVVVVIVFAVIGSLIFFFCWDSHVGFYVIACWYVLKIFFSALCDRLGLPSFGSIFFVCGSVVLLAVLCASCDYLGAMGDSSSTPPMSLSHHAPA